MQDEQEAVILFNQIRNQCATRASTRRLLLGATLGACAWLALCVSGFVELSALPSGAEVLTAPLCPCHALQAQPQTPLEERQHFSILRRPLRERRAAALP
jgi:hypothetical protein